MKTDILVIGDGPSAVAAAVTASRMGAKTTLMIRGSERSLGGGLTKRTAFQWRGSASSPIWEEVKERLGEQAQGRYKPAALSAALHDMVKEAKINIVSRSLLGVQRSDEGEGRIITSILAAGKPYPAKRYSSIWIDAKVYIDATGTAEAANEAGLTDRESDRTYEEPKLVGLETQFRTVLNWPCDMQFTSKTEFVGELQARMDREKLRYKIDSLLVRKTGEMIEDHQKYSLIEVHMTGWRTFDTFGYDEGVKAVELMRNAVRENVDALKDSQWTGMNWYDGLQRASNCRGLYRLTEEDICAGRILEDWVVSGAVCGFDSETIGDAVLETPEYDGRAYTISMGSLLSAGCDNLILSGRGICASDMARRSISSAPIAFALGEAAGAAAALAVRHGCLPKNLAAEEIQLELMNRGVMKPENCKE